MVIGHVAPFALNRCGLYEAARDMARADIYGGNDVFFFDAGITINGKREDPKLGASDNRAGFNLTAADYSFIDCCDVIVMHTGISDSAIVRNQAPLLWIVHGRPLACFRPERMGNSTSYSLYHNLSKWKRTKGMVYFWPEFKPHWENVLSGKDIVLDYPVIDETRFNISDDMHNLANRGKHNILICDSEREDVDLYEMTVGLIEAAKKYNDIRIHFYGLDFINGKLPDCWNITLNELRKCGCLGDVSGRVGNMEKLYNAVDCVMSPNKIVTRVIGEAISCGIPVVSNSNKLNKISDYTCDMTEPTDIVATISKFISDKENGLISRESIRNRADIFSMKHYSARMNEVYKNII